MDPIKTGKIQHEQEESFPLQLLRNKWPLEPVSESYYLGREPKANDSNLNATDLFLDILICGNYTGNRDKLYIFGIYPQSSNYLSNELGRYTYSCSSQSIFMATWSI